MGISIEPLTVIGQTQASKQILASGESVYKNISIFFPIGDLSEKSKHWDLSTPLFFLGHILDGFESYLKNWYAKSEVLDPVYKLYFGTLANSSMYLEHTFLSLSQALEAYHRETHDGKYVANKTYNPIRKTLLSHVPEDIDSRLKKGIENALNYTNSYTLRERLAEIWNEHKDVISIIFPEEEKFNQFKDDFVDTRNLLTHHDRRSARAGELKDISSLHRLTQQSRLILEICFLIEFGMPKDSIKILVSKNRRFERWSVR